MGRAKLKLETKEPNQQMLVYYKRKIGIAKKAKELSILCDTKLLLISIDPKGKADLVLGPNTKFEDVVNWFSDASPKERSKSKLEGIQNLKKAFKGNDHEIDVQQLMNLGGSGSSHAMQLGLKGTEQMIWFIRLPLYAHGYTAAMGAYIYNFTSEVMGPQSSINMTEEIQQMQNLCAVLVNKDKLHMINSKDDLNLMEVAVENLIQLNTKLKMEMSVNRNRARASASAFQQLTNQGVMNHPGPPIGNPMNHGTILLQPNMNPGGNSDTVSDLLMAAPPLIKEEAAFHSPDAIDDLFAHEWGFGACFPGN